MADGPQPQPGIMEISLYEGGASSLAGIENVIKLSSNENPWGPSDKAIEAVIHRRTDLAEEVIALDARIDELEARIDELRRADGGGE